jgi:flagellar hook-associated protein 1
MIATASAANPTLGDSANVSALADIITTVELSYGEKPATFRAHFESVIGAMAVESQETVRLTQNSGVLRSAVEERRMSVSGVSLDEEMTNMIKFQHAYNASARMITLQDEMLDKIINGMGTVGR